MEKVTKMNLAMKHGSYQTVIVQCSIQSIISAKFWATNDLAVITSTLTKSFIIKGLSI